MNKVRTDNYLLTQIIVCLVTLFTVATLNAKLTCHQQ